MEWKNIFDNVLSNVKNVNETNQSMKYDYDDFIDLIVNDNYQEEKIGRFLKASNNIASIRNRPFYKKEVEILSNKKNWASLRQLLKDLYIAIDADKPQKYNLYKERITEILSQQTPIQNNAECDPDARDTSNGKEEQPTIPHAAILRLAASILPNYLTSIAADGNMIELWGYLKKSKLISESFTNKTDFEKSNFLWKEIHQKFEDYKNSKKDKKEDITNVEFYCIPWRILEYFRGDDVRDIERLVRDHMNLILTGAPGTGKTFLAKKVASLIITGNSDFENLTKDELSKFNTQFKFVQFHPSYDYTDFVEGLRPDSDIQFKRTDGIFKSFCAEATKHNKNQYVIVIDEINRGEISKIFGELFFSIDPDYRGEKGKVDTQYQNLVTKKPFDKGFYVPENVFVIGTMNDIDRSVESMDFAFRRRFAFHEITAESTAKQILLGIDDSDELLKRMTALNSAIIDASIGGLSTAYQIGASYFKKIERITDARKDKYKSLYDTFLKGVLYEYFRGLPKKDVDDIMKKLEKAYYTN